MATSGMCYLLLTCATQQEARLIARRLLEERLIICAKYSEAKSMYWWQGAITEDEEVIVMMEASVERVAEIEAVVATLHSYETFVLTKVAMEVVNSTAQAWVSEELSDQASDS